MNLLNRLVLISLVLLPSVTSAQGDEVEINVLGKGATTYDLPDGAGFAFFSLLGGVSSLVGEELEDRLGDVDYFGVGLREVNHLNVDPNIFLAFEATSSELRFGSLGLGFDVDADFTCPYFGILYGCQSISADITLQHLMTDGNVNYLNGEFSFVFDILPLEPPNLDIDLDVETILPLFPMDFLWELAADELEPIVESSLGGDLIDGLDFVLLDLSGVVEVVTPHVEAALDVDLAELFQNPFVGLLVDIALIDNPEKIDIVVSRRRPAPTGSVVMSGGVEKPKLSWGAVPGAARYHVFKKSNSSSQWSYRGTTTASQWVDLQYNGRAGTFLEAGTPGGNEWLSYHVVAENALYIQSQASGSVRFAIIQESGGGGGGGPW